MAAQFLHLPCKGGGSPPCLPVSYATGYGPVVRFGDKFKCNKNIARVN